MAECCSRILLPPCVVRSGVVESARRATVTREAQVRGLPPELSRPRGRTGDDAGPSTRKLRVRAPPGVLIHLVVGELGHPAGFGRRRSQVRLLPTRLRGRGAAVLASLMSSRSWVRIPPARSSRGRSSGAERSLVRRSAAGSNPVVPVHGGRGVTAAPEVVNLEVPVRARSASLSTHADAEHAVSSAACNADAFRLWWFDSTRPHLPPQATGT